MMLTMSNEEEYLITAVRKISTRKVCVEINYDVKFSLYSGEASRFNIEQGRYLAKESYDEIFKEILPKRARERCYNLLTKRSMTEYELTRKLKEGYYPQEIIDHTIQLMSGSKLINDDDYARTYVELSHKGKSKRRLMQDMSRKGIPSDTISQVLNDSDIDEQQNIRELMLKKHIDTENASPEELQKFAAFLLRKGYDYDIICKMIFNS